MAPIKPPESKQARANRRSFLLRRLVIVLGFRSEVQRGGGIDHKSTAAEFPTAIPTVARRLMW